MTGAQPQPQSEPQPKPKPQHEIIRERERTSPIRLPVAVELGTKTPFIDNPSAADSFVANIEEIRQGARHLAALMWIIRPLLMDVVRKDSHEAPHPIDEPKVHEYEFTYPLIYKEPRLQDGIEVELIEIEKGCPLHRLGTFRAYPDYEGMKFIYQREYRNDCAILDLFTDQVYDFDFREIVAYHAWRDDFLRALRVAYPPLLKLLPNLRGLAERIR